MFLVGECCARSCGSVVAPDCFVGLETVRPCAGAQAPMRIELVDPLRIELADPPRIELADPPPKMRWLAGLAGQSASWFALQWPAQPLSLC